MKSQFGDKKNSVLFFPFLMGGGISAELIKSRLALFRSTLFFILSALTASRNTHIERIYFTAYK